MPRGNGPLLLAGRSTSLVILLTTTGTIRALHIQTVPALYLLFALFPSSNSGRSHRMRLRPYPRDFSESSGTRRERYERYLLTRYFRRFGYDSGDCVSKTLDFLFGSRELRRDEFCVGWFASVSLCRLIKRYRSRVIAASQRLSQCTVEGVRWKGKTDLPRNSDRRLKSHAWQGR